MVALPFILRPEVPFRQIYSFGTAVIKVHNGREFRIALRDRPRVEYDFEVLLPDDASRQRWMSQWLNRTNGSQPIDQVELPLWHEEVKTTADVIASATTIPGDFSLSDLAGTDSVWIASADGATYEKRVVDTVSAGQITVTVGLTNAYNAGASVFPLITGEADDSPVVSLFPVNGSRMGVRVFDVAQRDVGGNGASLSTYQGLPILDRRPIAGAQAVFDGDIDVIDFGNAFEFNADWQRADIVYSLSFVAKGKADRQWWKAFLAAVDGQQGLFYEPTWLHDLNLSAQPSQGSATILITDEPDYITEYQTSTSHRDLYLDTAGGIVTRRVASAVDNGNGTITLTLDSALPNDADLSTIIKISFLEVRRLGADVVSIDHFDEHSEISLAVRSIQEDPAVGVIDVSIADSIRPVDILRLNSILVRVSDSVSLADSVAAGKIRAVKVVDTVLPTDGVGSGSAYLTDSFSTSDKVTIEPTFIVDTLAAEDSVSRALT